MERGVVLGNVFDKYGSRNPVYRRIVNAYFRELDGLLHEARARRILEVGCGEGYVGNRLKEKLLDCDVWGLDLSRAMLAEASRNYRGVKYICGSAYSLPFARRSFDLVLCLEVLEHLWLPEDALREIRRVSRGVLIASVPNEPLWRLLNLARGAYWDRLGNTPGHVQHWSRRRFIALLDRHWVVRRVVTPYPWTMALCSLG